jgi:hypothetical protein
VFIHLNLVSQFEHNVEKYDSMAWWSTHAVPDSLMDHDGGKLQQQNMLSRTR